MDFIKNLFEDIKTSSFVEKVTNMLRPTENWLLNKGGLKVMLMVIPLLVLNTVVTGVLTTLSLKASGLIVWIVTFLVNILLFVFVSMGASAACLQGYDMLVNKNRMITMGEFIHVAKTKAIDFTIKYIKYIAIYTVALSIVAALVNKIPFIKGYSTINLLKAFLVYGLYFRMYADMLGKDGNSEIINKKEYWITFALVAYVLKTITSFSLISSFIKYSFILFTVLCLSDVNTNDVSNSSDDMFDGFEEVIKNEPSIKKSNNNYSNHKPNNFSFEDNKSKNYNNSNNYDSFSFDEDNSFNKTEAKSTKYDNFSFDDDIDSDFDLFDNSNSSNDKKNIKNDFDMYDFDGAYEF